MFIYCDNINCNCEFITDDFDTMKQLAQYINNLGGNMYQVESGQGWHIQCPLCKSSEYIGID